MPRRRAAAAAAGDAPAMESHHHGQHCGGRQRWRLVGFDELPAFLRDNEFVRSGYRSEWPLLDALLSVALWHNESINVWTHLGGFMAFLWLAVDTAAAAGSLLGTSVPLWPKLVFLAGGMFCLLGSATMHLFGCHSPCVSSSLRCVDYSGIVVMIVGSFVPAIYYSFLCHRTARSAYLAGIAALGALSIAALAAARSNPRFRPLRIALFLALGLSGIIPSAHALWINYNCRECHLALAFELVMAAAYVGGAGLYASRIPERWSPGKFDFVGQSHQIFHVLVLVGAFTHYAAVSILLGWRQSTGACTAAAATALY